MAAAAQLRNRLVGERPALAGSPRAPALTHGGDRDEIRIAEPFGEHTLLAGDRLRLVEVAEVGGVGGHHVQRQAATLEVAGGGAEFERCVGVGDALVHAQRAQEDRAGEPCAATRTLAGVRLQRECSVEHRGAVALPAVGVPVWLERGGEQ